MIKQSIQFPNNQYQHIQQQVNTSRNILSFSRSLGKLKWDQNEIQLNRKNTNKAVKQIVTNRQQYIISSNKQNDQYKMTKQLSRLYDQYPVNTKKEPQEQFEYLPFIPSELLLKPLKIDPKYTQMLLPKNRQPMTLLDLSQKKISHRKVYITKKYEAQIYDKKDLNYFNSDESSFVAFTTLKDYLLVQNSNNIVLQQDDNDVI